MHVSSLQAIVAAPLEPANAVPPVRRGAFAGLLDGERRTPAAGESPNGAGAPPLVDPGIGPPLAAALDSRRRPGRRGASARED